MACMARVARMFGFALTLLFLGAGKSYGSVAAISAIIHYWPASLRRPVCMASILARKRFNASLISDSDPSYSVQTMMRRPRIDHICE